MVTELEVKTFAEKSVKMPLFTGYLARGLALNILNRIDPALSQDLHEPNALKPYSVTPLYFRSTKKHADGYQLDPSTPCILKVRFLDDKIAKSALDFFSSNESMMVYDTPFKVASLTIRTEDFSKVPDARRAIWNLYSGSHERRLDSDRTRDRRSHGLYQKSTDTAL